MALTAEESPVTGLSSFGRWRSAATAVSTSVVASPVSTRNGKGPGTADADVGHDLPPAMKEPDYADRYEW